jgi:PAS domain S-box-containing protein
MDEAGRIMIWTPRAETLFGWKEEEVIGRLLADTIVPRRFREQHLAGLQRYLSTRVPHIMNRMVEVTACNREGREFPVELTVVEIQGQKGIFFCSFIRDISERILARQQIEKEKNLSDSIIESLPGLFYLFDEQEKYIRWNRQKEKISGFSFKEVAEMSPLDFFADEDKLMVRAHIQEAFQTGSTVLEAPLRTRSGRKIPFYFTGLRVEYEGRTCLLGMGIDISERVKAEDLLRESSRRLRELSAHLQTVREEERISISREIHDELGQQLTVMKMDISWLKRKLESDDEKVNRKMDDLMRVIDHTVKTVRKISSDLRPSLLDDLGLKAALEWHCTEFEKRSGVETTFTANFPDIDMSHGVGTALFRVFQETLTNVARHSQATKVQASLNKEDGMLVMRIKDNGIGFNPGSIENKKTLGILGMQERVAIIQGEYRIESNTGEGTLVEVKVPIGYLQTEKQRL